MTKLIPPDDFTNDWFGWAKSQTAHIFVGIFLAFALSMVSFVVIGEFPKKTDMLALIFVGYFLGFKLLLQGWQGWDTIEDVVFVVGYGAAGPLAASMEIEPGKAAIIMDLEPLLPYFYICVAHLIAGVSWRAYQVK